MDKQPSEGWHYRRGGFRGPVPVGDGDFLIPFGTTEHEAVEAFREAWRAASAERETIETHLLVHHWRNAPQVAP